MSMGTVWQNTVDQGTWIVQVERVQPYQGVLTVVRASDKKEVHREEVGLAYDSLFGPDVDDLARWQDRCIEIIDAQEESAT